MLVTGASRIFKFVTSDFRVYDVDRLGYFNDFSQQLSSFVRRPQRVLPPFAGTCSYSSLTPITQSRPSPLSTPPPSSR